MCYRSTNHQQTQCWFSHWCFHFFFNYSQPFSFFVCVYAVWRMGNERKMKIRKTSSQIWCRFFFFNLFITSDCEMIPPFHWPGVHESVLTAVMLLDVTNQVSEWGLSSLQDGWFSQVLKGSGSWELGFLCNAIMFFACNNCWSLPRIEVNNVDTCLSWFLCTYVILYITHAACISVHFL